MGLLLCTKVAMDVMSKQSGVTGHVRILPMTRAHPHGSASRAWCIAPPEGSGLEVAVRLAVGWQRLGWRSGWRLGWSYRIDASIITARMQIFQTVGSGVKGGGTPGYVAYGATKRGLPRMRRGVRIGKLHAAAPFSLDPRSTRARPIVDRDG